ncbi:MAG TPA: transporter [Thermoanaerobaculia bacterium]|nr:transporter [Thermoanaerobaculia bacterium]
MQGDRTPRPSLSLAVVLAISSALVGGLAFAQGGPPLVTEDPGTPGAGRWEINIAGEGEELDGDRWIAAPVLDLNYGLGDRIQLKLEVPWAVSDPRVGSTRSGLGLWELGVKWRFLDRGEEGLRVSVYPQVELPVPGTDETLVGDGSSLSLPVQAAQVFGKVEMSAEAGYLVVEGEEDGWFAGVAVGLAARPKLELVAEMYASWVAGAGHELTGFNAGIAFDLGDRLALLASAGRALTGEGPDLTAYLGVQILR